MRRATLDGMIFFAGLLAIAATVSPVALVSESLAAVTDPARPLGVLIFPDESQTAPPAVRPVPQAVSTPSPPAPLTPAANEQTTDKPLGTLWYQEPYNANHARPTAVPIPTPAAAPAENGVRPLGMLWYPHRYVPDTPEPVSLPLSSPSLRPTMQSPAPAISAPISKTLAAPAYSSIGRSQAKPLGMLWNPGPFKPVTPSEPLTPAATGATSSSPATRAAVPEPDRPDTPPVRMSADEMSFDRERGIVTATGNVVISSDERTLVSDTVSYDQNANVVTATGKVTLIEPGGEKIFGDTMQISGDLKDAVVHNFGLIMADRSRIAGAGARRSQGIVTEMHKTVYSPCNLCADTPERPPLWQLKAVKVIHDKNEQIVEYRDAWLEVFGVPVAYTPYFRHPDPTVKRQTGFLFPTYGSSSDLGLRLETPFFWNISPYEDMTVRPIILSEKTPVLDLEYRRRFMNGVIDLRSSVTDKSSDDDDFSTEDGSFGVRGHIDSEGRFNIDDTWRWGFDVKRASDDTYMRRYGFASPQSLNSQLFIEGFRKRNYFSANAYAFQGLEVSDEQDQIPIILPLVDFSHVGNRDKLGGRTKLGVNFLALSRKEGTDTRRLSVRPNWERPFADTLGGLYNLSFELNADLYHVNSLARTGNKGKFSGVSGRLVPLAVFDWRMPFIRSEQNIYQIFEPIASVIWSQNGGNPDNIPNEDSTELEFDETNLFSTNRFSGLDRVEGGVRLNYGLKWVVSSHESGSSRFFLGQTYRPRTDGTFPIGSGLEDNFSDIVGRVDISPGSHLNLGYRTRFSTNNFSPRRNEVEMTAGIPAFLVNANYVFLERQQDSEFVGREELTASANSQINRFWRIGANARRDMEANQIRAAGVSLIYENECVVFTTNLTRTFFEDRDLKPTDAFTFNVILKTIGEVHPGFGQIQ